MAIQASSIKPEVALRDFLNGKVIVNGLNGRSEPVTVYCDRERPTNGLPDDFISIAINGSISGLGKSIDYADGYIMVILYCKMNADGSVKDNRVTKIIEQFDYLLNGVNFDNYYFCYEYDNFVMPTTPDFNSGYSLTILNLRWHTANKFNADPQPGSGVSGSGAEYGA